MSILNLLVILVIGLGIAVVIENARNEKNEKAQKHMQSQEDNYQAPQLKELTEEQIADIHARGKITPAEKLKEWEGIGLCAPGDAIGGTAWRCHKFRHNCHDCLVDYANEHDEYTSIYDNLIVRTPK